MLVKLWMVGTLIAVVGLSSCSGEGQSERNTPTPPADVDSYVALGDSFVSGPGIKPKQRDSGVCLRSKRNWPAIVSNELGLSDVRDVSCAGAGTHHMFNDVGTGEDRTPAQLDFLERSTELVTVGIGANDEGLLPGLVVACSRRTMPAPDACSTFVESTLPRVLEETVRPNLSRVLDEVRRRSPDARVMLVGYLRMAPEGDGCSDLPVKSPQLADFVDGEQAIDAELARAASKAGVQYLSAYELSEGRDACAGRRAWVNGSNPRKGDGEVLHPRASGMRAVAAAAIEALR
jgi:lysophospholipase L1-like esterase